MKRAGTALLVVAACVAVLAPWLAPNPPDARFDRLLFAPPTRIHVAGDGIRAPFIYRWNMVSRLERRFEEARNQPVTLRWFTRDALVTADPQHGAPLLLLGADAYGRDVFARLVYGSRVTLALALLSTALATAIGLLVGGIAGYAGGWIDDWLSRMTEFVLILPAIYVALALRAALPLVLPASTIFLLLTVIFALFGWPVVARGVRAIVLSERGREYALAARATGMTPLRLLLRHLVPAAAGYVRVQATLLVPAFILAEATLSYIGFGFPDTTPTWGTMLQDAANISLAVDAPWLLAPAAAIFAVVLAVNLVVQGMGRAPVQLER